MRRSLSSHNLSSMRFNFSLGNPWFTVWVRWLPSYSLDVKSNVNLFVFTEHLYIQVSFNKNKVIVCPASPLYQSPQNCNQVSGHQFSLFIKFSFLQTSYFVRIVWILFDQMTKQIQFQSLDWGQHSVCVFNNIGFL